jgi:DNA-binding NarL/FixJ family response regulator
VSEVPGSAPQLFAAVDAATELRDAVEQLVATAGIGIRDGAADDAGPDLTIVALVTLSGASREIAVSAARRPGLPVLVLVAETAPTDGEALVGAIRAGADGIVPLSTTAAGLRRTGDALVRGECVIPRGDLAPVVAALRASDPVPQGRVRLLSPRELLVLRRLAAGRTTAQVAAELHVTPSAVRAYSSRAVGKLRAGCLGAALELVNPRT